MPRPPFRADHVGSFLRPERLKEAREKFAAGGLAAQDLHAIEDECIREVVRAEENVGLKGITDGEFRRTYFHVDFLERLEGRRDPLRRIRRHLPQEQRHGGRLQAADDACRQQGPLGRADPGPGLRFPEVGDDPHAKGLHPGALDAAFPRRARGDQRGGLSGPRGFLRRSHRRLPRRGRRSCRARLPVSAVRRHQSRLSLRSGHPRPHQGARRRSGRADPALLPARSTIRSATGRPT